jgi:hypothetical protein
MTEMDVTPDAAEQGATTPNERLDDVEVGAETSEADAVEQSLGDALETPRDVRSIPDDVPEADALEQSYEVPLDEDYGG